MKPGWLHLAWIALLYYGGTKLGAATALSEGMAILWPANAVVLAALLRFNGAGLAGIGAVVVAAQVVADVPTFTALEALLFGLVNLGQSVAAFFLLRRLAFDAPFPALADLWKFLLAAPLAASLAGALAGAAVYVFLHGSPTGYAELVRAWWFADALGLVIVTPLLLGFAPFRTLPSFNVPPQAPLAGAALGLAAAGAVAAVWMKAAPLVLVLPLVLYVAVRYPPRWAAVAVAGAAALVGAALLQARTPFGALPLREALFQAQQYILVTSLLGLGCAALLAQLRGQQQLLEQRVTERTRELQTANAELARLASLDPLTGVGNRRLFDELLVAEAARVQRYGGALSLVIADIDYFKEINDSHGHAAGDEVIRAVAAVLRQAARGADSVARYGGEEFAVVLPQTVAAQAVYFAERARRAVAEKVLAPQGKRVTISLGVAEIRPGGDAAQLLRDADEALYRAKQEGRNRVARADRLLA